MLELLKVLSSIGALGLLMKIFSSKFFSTEVEKALEMNYERIARTVLDYIITLFIIIIGLIVLTVFTMPKKDIFNNKDFEVSNSKEKADKTIEKNKKNTDVEIYIMGTLILVVLTFLIYVSRDIHNKLYKKNTYIWYTREGHKYKVNIEKRIEKDRILLTNVYDSNWHKIVSISTLEEYIIHTDTLSEINERRYKMAYESMQTIIKSKWRVKTLFGFFVAIGLAPSAISIFEMMKKEDWKSMAILIIFICTIFIYAVFQYKNGKKLARNSQN